MIYGIGIEIVDISRFRSAMERRGPALLKRLFTEDELSYCRSKRRPEVHLAARFAAKLSLFKALGRTFGFHDVEIVRGPGGEPSFRIEGVESLGLRVSLSLTHDGGVGIAETVVEKSEYEEKSRNGGSR